MSRQKFMIITCLAMLVTALWGIGPPSAQAVDETKIPHYFGPYPNWALSQLPAGTCSVTTTTACISDAGCPGGETCNRTTVTGGIKKFQDGLPGLCDPRVTAPAAGNCTDATNNLGQYIPLAVPDTTTFTTANGFADEADYYVIAVVQHRERMNSSLPAQGTLLREYVQLQTPANADAPWNKKIPLMTDLPDGTSVPTLMPDGTPAIAVDNPHYLGPVIAATKDKPVRIVFYNLLPKDAGGNLFLPVDSTLMGSGMGPMAMMDPMNDGTVDDLVRNPECSDVTKGTNHGCFKDNRATIHLHGGISPWISDGTPHQWITPATESTPWPEGVSVRAVPDMINVPGVPNCSAANDGCMTFYYTNQQSARLMFYHDHSWGITRLNVYAGEAAGYVITDATEKKLLPATADNPTGLGLIPGAADTIPLVIQDRTFVPDPAQMAALDPTWDYTRWGKEGDLWYHHVYMPAQNPGDMGGMSGYGRWMFGPWFWPPATPLYGPIANPYYNVDPKGPDGIRGRTCEDLTTICTADANCTGIGTGICLPTDDFTTLLATPCNLDNPATWQYQTDPFCEPPLIPGTPNISVGMEQFNDTPVVNGTAYPTKTVEPKTYRLRILNAANDRFFNLQWYVADATGTEVALNAAEVAAAQLDPVVFPTPDTTLSPAGPAWVQIGSEGGFLPAPVVIPNQPITWITDPTRFDVGNVDLHSLLLAPAERADVIVDFSQFRGKTLILYNDAPAAFPARVPSYDYYTGAPDQWPVGAPSVLPGYGPNTRTVMQIKVTDTTPADTFNLAALQAAFAHQPDGSGVFESGQHPIIVGQAAYNSAYGLNFAGSSWCNVPSLNINICDGFARISDQGGDLFGFNTLSAPAAKLQIPIQPKAIHDEMNAVAFDEFGRMTANLGVEVVPATPATQNVVLYPFVNPITELIDGTNLPTNLNVTPITTQDGTQIWKITHNGVDTHPIHFHLYDVQVLNRVTWDNIIIPPDANELGWKDTVRISPLEDTIVALRPVIPTVPFDLPNSIRMQNPMTMSGSTMGFNNTDINGNPTTAITNKLVNFGAEYMYHCHILSHEEMDMMRPVVVALPPKAPTLTSFSSAGTGNNSRIVVNWNDNSINETGFLVQRTTNDITWTDVGTSPSPLDQLNTTGTRTLTDPTSSATTPYRYRIVAQNTVGYGGQFPSMTATSVSNALGINLPATPPAAPTILSATLQAGPRVTLTWRDNATNEANFGIERSTDGVNFTRIALVPARNNTGNVTFVDTAMAASVTNTYTYKVAAINLAGAAYSGTISVIGPAVPAAPGSFTAANGTNGTGNNRTVNLSWVDNSGTVETGFTIQRATNATFTAGLNTTNVGANTTSLIQTGLNKNTQYYYRIRANNGAIVSSAWVNATPFPIRTNP
ncbi:multicopper oxidase domain-containing protein [Geobacter sp.]|uniref:multicopper oxidase domain-containing protein n=1 Tax=Geobacter sp. TaxID=46610 RepID=UPI001AC2AA4C|nr:multicopper oxidase domain-containing protein [Geobacter sp.]CAG0990120.1 Spore coat protein A [Anaerolineales bacterium]